MIRCVTDEISVVYIQDVLVDPAYQRRGLGTALMRALESEYAHVRLKVLLTDDTPVQTQFYTGLDYRDSRTLTARRLNAFLSIKDDSLI